MPRSPSTLIPIADAVGPAAAHAMASALRDAGIEAFVFDTAKSMLQWEAPRVIAPYQVHVARADAEAAAELLKANREDSVDIDWNEVDVGEPEDQTAASISRTISAPWTEHERPSRRPIRDRVFGVTKFYIVLWIFVLLAVAVAGAVFSIIQIFFTSSP